MSTLTDSGVIQEVIAGLYTGEESTLGGAGYVKRLMFRVIEGTLVKTYLTLGARGKIIASVPLEVIYPISEIVTDVDAPVTVPVPYAYGSTGAIVVNDEVTVEGCWRAFAASTSTLETPVDSTVEVAFGEVASSSGAIVVDSVAAGNGIVKMYGSWSLT